MLKKVLASLFIIASISIGVSIGVEAMDKRVKSSYSDIATNDYIGTAWAYGHVTAAERHYANVEMSDTMCTHSIMSGRTWNTGRVEVRTDSIYYDNWGCDAAGIHFQLWSRIFYGFSK